MKVKWGAKWGALMEWAVLIPTTMWTSFGIGIGRRDADDVPKDEPVGEHADE